MERGGTAPRIADDGTGTIGLAATQVNVFVNTVLATGEGTGAVSWLNYAFRLMYLPTGLFGVSIATATVPAVSRHAARSDNVAVRGTLAEGLSLMLVMSVPATVGLIVLATPVVRVIFERRAFLPSDTAATAAALQFYASGWSATRSYGSRHLRFTHRRQPAPVKTALPQLSQMPVELALVRVWDIAAWPSGRPLRRFSTRAR